MYNRVVKYNIKNPPRVFKVGTNIKFNLYDCGDELHADEYEYFKYFFADLKYKKVLKIR